MKPLKLAYVAADGLGDGVIQTLVTQYLSLLGHEVNYYQDLLYKIDPIVDDICLKPTTELNRDSLRSTDWILLDKGSKSYELFRTTPELWAKTLVFSMSKTKPGRELFNREISKFDDPLLRMFNGQRLRTRSAVGTIVDQVEHIFRLYLNVDHGQRAVKLTLPVDWKNDINCSRVLIHPTSSNARKNWSLAGYVKLARLLSHNGYEPVFTMSPGEAKYLRREIDEQFPIVTFPSTMSLAKYYSQSAMLIGNDSGNGHFASMLGLPTVTVVNVRKRYFAWRPGWGSNTLVRPWLSRRLVGSHLWQKSISTHRVYNAVVDTLELSTQGR